MHDFENYLSPFSWRYGSQGMRHIWSEDHARRLWRRIWLALAEVQAEYGLVTAEQLDDLRQHAEAVDLGRSLAVEAETHHDLVAELQVFASQCPVGGGILHLGATSMDVKDNADALRLAEALELILASLAAVLDGLAEHIERWADLPVIAYTHLQPAEPSTLGYRLAQYGQDLLTDYQNLSTLRHNLRGKGLRGAVGTSASFADLIGPQHLPEFEARLSERLGLRFYPVVTQTYPRKQDYAILSALAGLGASLYKFAFDLRVMQSPAIGELSEPFGEAQVGSSAMPFKRNPIQAEKINSLARYLAAPPRVAWDNAAHSLLERTLDDSANRRIVIPQAFLAADEILSATKGILAGLSVDQRAIARNLETYGPFAATERVLMALGKAGADRQEMHARLRQHALSAWEAIQDGQANPLAELIAADEVFAGYLAVDELNALMEVGDYLGDAPERARALTAQIREAVADGESPQ